MNIQLSFNREYCQELIEKDRYYVIFQWKKDLILYDNIV